MVLLPPRNGLQVQRVERERVRRAESSKIAVVHQRAGVINKRVGSTRVPGRPTLAARGGTIGPHVLVPATFARVVAPPRPLLADSARVLTLRLHPRVVIIEYRQDGSYPGP